MNDSFDDRLPPDLRDIAERVRVSRAEASPFELDELKRSARAKATRRGRSLRPTGRLAMRSRVLTLGITALLIGGTTAGGIAGTSNNGNGNGNNAACAQYKPGNGYGDKNHTHYGPPGQGNTNPCTGSGPGNSGNAPGHNK